MSFFSRRECLQRRAGPSARKRCPARRPARPAVRLVVELLECRWVPAVHISQNFPGMSYLDNFGIRPPDTQMAVGPTAVVSAVNTTIAVYNKHGQEIVPVHQLSDFFGKVFVRGAGHFLFDPQVLYDDVSSRWYVAADEGKPAPNALGLTADLVLAVSKDSNPLDGWVFYKFTKVEEPVGGIPGFPDHPQIGWNHDGVFVSFNQIDPSGAAFHDQIFELPKDDLLAGAPIFPAEQVQNDVTLATQNQLLMPARMHDSAVGGPEYYVGVDTEGAGTSTIGVWKETPVLTPGNLPVKTDVAVGDFFGVPGSRTHAGSSAFGLGDLFLSVDGVTNGAGTFLAATDNVTVATDGGANIHVRWYEFDVTGAPAEKQEGTVFAGDFDTYVPAIAINESEDIGLTYIASEPFTAGANKWMIVNGRLGTDALGTLEAGPGIVAKFGGFGAPTGDRTGDYAAAEFDPTDHTVFWTANEYNVDNGSTNDWGTNITSFHMF